MIWLPYGEKLWQYVKPFFIQYQRVTDRQSDGRTDRIAISILRVNVLTLDKNRKNSFSKLTKFAFPSLGILYR